MEKVFLGGTCNGSSWRNRMMAYLDDEGVKYFNPVVDHWDNVAQENELREREQCRFCLYTITPKKIGDYSIAEVVDDSNKRPGKTLLVLLHEDDDLEFSEIQWKSLDAVAKMIKRNGGQVFYDLKIAAQYMASHKEGCALFR